LLNNISQEEIVDVVGEFGKSMESFDTLMKRAGKMAEEAVEE